MSDKKKTIWLSIVVIGRNEEAHLPALFDSLPAGLDTEWIYVDSGSTDGSVKIALAKGARTYRIKEASVFGAGTGRYVGTREAKGEWILYIDGDMRLREEFKKFIERLRAADSTELKDSGLPSGTAGFVGITRNCFFYEDGSPAGEVDYAVLPKAKMGPPEQWGKPARYHGGAVIYRKSSVAAAGNWNPAVYQLEEVDLLSRVSSRGETVRAIDLPMVEHYTPYLSQVEKIKLNFLPQWRGKKLIGAGQVVTARLREGGLVSFVAFYPAPFTVLLALLCSPLLYLAWPYLPLLVNGGLAAYYGLTGKWYYYLVYLGNSIQVLRGLNQYRRFEPEYVEIDSP